MSVDVGEPEVNSKRQQDINVEIPMEIADSELDEIEEEGDLMMTRSERKRERRKTLKEYFLDSPPETENATAVELPVLINIAFQTRIGSSLQWSLCDG